MKSSVLLAVFIICLSVVPASATTTTFTYDNLDRLTKADYSTTKAIGSISYSYDDTGNLLSLDRINLRPQGGDLNNDKAIGLKDAIIGLQLLTGSQPIEAVDSDADVDGDGKLGLEEVLYSLHSIITQ